MAREDVEASQRGRMVVAMVSAVAEKGYRATTVGDVVERAGVSRRTFYEQFDDIESCFLAAYDTGVEVALTRLADAARDLRESADWRSIIRSDLETYMGILAGDPAFAWSLHIEVLGAGPPALERRAAIFALFSDRVRRLYDVAREQDPKLPELAPEVFLFHSGGVDELIRECLRTRGADALPDLVDPAVRATLALFGEG